MAGVKHSLVYSVTTLDPPELVKHIKGNYDCKFNHQPRALLTEMVENKGCLGPPTIQARWCCEMYKENTGNGQYKILGIRAAESPRRRKIWKQLVADRKDKSSFILNPILYWTTKDIWKFHADQKIPYCRLYKEGFSRLGCIGCPLARSKKQKQDFNRWPKYEKLWRRAFDRYWLKWHNVLTLTGKRRWHEDFGSAENLWQWWLRCQVKSDDDECLGITELWG